jgi:hypothetical protein
MVVVKSQFEEWMEMVTALKSEVAHLSQAARADKDNRSHDAFGKQTELTALVELACNTFTQDCKEIELGSQSGWLRPLNLDSVGLEASPEFAQLLAGNANSDLNLFCKLIHDMLGHASRVWKRCANEAAKCHEAARTVADKAESIQVQLLDTRQEWKREADIIHQQLFRLPNEASHSASEVASLRKDLSTISDLHVRLQCVERKLDVVAVPKVLRSPERPGQKLEARRTILQAVESMEAAAQRVAQEASKEASTSSQPWPVPALPTGLESR